MEDANINLSGDRHHPTLLTHNFQDNSGTQAKYKHSDNVCDGATGETTAHKPDDPEVDSLATELTHEGFRFC